MGLPGGLSPVGTAGHGLCALSVVSRLGFRDLHPSQTPGHPENGAHGPWAVGVGSASTLGPTSHPSPGKDSVFSPCPPSRCPACALGLGLSPGLPAAPSPLPL